MGGKVAVRVGVGRRGPQFGCEGCVVFERGYCSTGLALFGFAGQMFACKRMQVVRHVGLGMKVFHFLSFQIVCHHPNVTRNIHST